MDFVGFCKRMEDNGKGTTKENTKFYNLEAVITVGFRSKEE
ncbi:virulence RhuM family protein [Pseudobacteroides cellulosolvens]|nr:virulence RhuM family protein [Pseudobacteroides cellulosolvens]